jgi:SHS2 domain-containing protein
MPYIYLDDLATADAAFRATGATIEETFRSAADALLGIMIENPESVAPGETREQEFEDESEEMLLFQLLQELVFAIDAQGFLFRLARMRIDGQPKALRLHATLAGEKLDRPRHRPLVDVKAVTLHQFALKETAEGWEAIVVVDI